MVFPKEPQNTHWGLLVVAIYLGCAIVLGAIVAFWVRLQGSIQFVGRGAFVRTVCGISVVSIFLLSLIPMVFLNLTSECNLYCRFVDWLELSFFMSMIGIVFYLPSAYAFSYVALKQNLEN